MTTVKSISSSRSTGFLCILAVFFSVMLPVVASAGDAGSMSEYELRSRLLREKPQIPHSDKLTGHTIVSLDKDWKVGQFNITWPETQQWIRSLGEGWRTPTREELEELFFKGLGLKRQHYKMPSFGAKPSPIGYDSFLAESRSESTVFCFDFYNGSSYWFKKSRRYYGFRALAVRDKKK